MADISPTTTTNTFADVANARAKVWKETFKKFASTADVLSPLEGPEGSGASIAVRNDIKGRRGDRIEFTASSELGGFGQLGESTLKGNEEDLKFSGTTAILEFKRHATALTSSLKKKMAGGHTLESLAAEVLGNHFGQWKQRDALRRLIDGVIGSDASAVADGTPLPSGGVLGGNEDKITDLATTGDAFGIDSIVDLTTQAAWLGVEPGRISRNGYPSSQDTYHHCLLADNQMLRPLLKTAGIQTQLSNAELRGATNPLFTGDLKEFDGTKILNIRGSYGDLNGPIGSPLTPVARLKATTGGQTDMTDKFLCGAQSSRATASGAIDAGLSDPDYFTDFRGHQYKYTEADTFAGDVNDYYIKVINPNGTSAIICYDGTIGAAADGSGTGNHGTHIKIKSSASNGLTGGAAGKDIATGALAFPCNATGVIFGYAILMGADAVIRAYGEDMRMTDDKDDYGFKHGIGYQAMYGDSVWKDRNERVRNYVLGVYQYDPIGSPKV
tara:strand:- start:202 stop:1698 length:1497 start_codon:yes stop_codon:yes gene_type:complete